MTGPCFVDANVFVYAQDTRDARKHRRAEEWLDELWRTRMGRTSAQALSEFYSVASRHRPRGRPKRTARAVAG